MKLRDFLAQKCSKCGSEIEHIYVSYDTVTSNWSTFPIVISPVLNFKLSDGSVMIDTNDPEMGLATRTNGDNYTRVYTVEGEGTCKQCHFPLSWKIDIYPRSKMLDVRTKEITNQHCPFCNNQICLIHQITKGGSSTTRCGACSFAYNANGNPMYRKNNLNFVYEVANNNIHVTIWSDQGIKTVIDNKACRSMMEYVTYCLSGRAEKLIIFM